jgi:hypothetical protein
MPTTVDNNTTYAGKYAGEYIRAAFLSNESLQHVTVKENIEYKAVVKKMTEADFAFAEATCNFTPTGDLTIGERYLTLKKLQVQKEICKNTFLDSWEAKDAQNGKLEAAFVENFLAFQLEQVAANNENLIWTGNGATAGQYDGLLHLIGEDADNDVIFGDNAAITSSNVIAKIQAAIGLAPLAIKRGTEKPLIYISADVWEAYMYAQIGTGFATYLTTGPEVKKTFMGLYEIVVCPGMPASTILFTQKSNLWFGTNVTSEWNNIQVVDMGQWAEDNVRFSAKFFAGTNYAIGSQLVASSPWF